MTRDEGLLNIIAGADEADDEDVALRRALVSTLRGMKFDRFLAPSVATSDDNAPAMVA
jgi:hypothetical protein